MKPPPKPPFPVGPPICLAHRIPGDCWRCIRSDRIAAWGIAIPCAIVATLLVYTLILRLLFG